MSADKDSRTNTEACVRTDYSGGGGGNDGRVLCVPPHARRCRAVDERGSGNVRVAKWEECAHRLNSDVRMRISAKL